MIMLKLITDMSEKYKEISFAPGDHFYWSPESKTVFYNSKGKGKTAKWSLLHETGHGLLGHMTFYSDLELIRLEIEAWEKAKELGKQFKVRVDEEHIQNCLDTYREWLYKRSICPTCSAKCLQLNDFIHYRCFNCHEVWRVSPNRFVRSYRSKHSDLVPALNFDLQPN
jgi:hypothetical protein